jgi:hypothetical protein
MDWPTFQAEHLRRQTAALESIRNHAVVILLLLVTLNLLFLALLAVA